MRRALLVGIDDYPDAPLSGAVADAESMAALLGTHHDGSPNFDVRLVTVPPNALSRGGLRSQIDDLFREPADVALFYFSGHGTENNLGGYLVTPDARSYDEGVNLAEVLAMANQSRARERVVILDSCMSGAFGAIPAIGGTTANLSEGVSVLTASRSAQTAMEVGGQGVFTDLVCGALRGGAADVVGDVTVASTYAYVEQALGPWEQRPLFKAHLSKLVSLRRADPAVPVEVLRRLPTWFPNPDTDFGLDPSYEDTDPSADPAHVQVFKQLQQCRDAKLVEAVGEDFLYYAATNSKSCRLTPLGRRYHRLAIEGRL